LALNPWETIPWNAGLARSRPLLSQSSFLPLPPIRHSSGAVYNHPNSIPPLSVTRAAGCQQTTWGMRHDSRSSSLHRRLRRRNSSSPPSPAPPLIQTDICGEPSLLRNVSFPASISALPSSQFTLPPISRNVVFCPSLACDSSRTDGDWLGSLVSPECELSRVDTCISALTTHASAPQTNFSFFDPPSGPIHPERAEIGWGR